MSSNTVGEAFAALESGVQAVGALDWDALPIRQRLELMERLETVRRQADACSLDIASSVDRSQDPAIGPMAYKVIADVLRVSLAEGRRRLRDAEQLRPRANLSGEVLPAELPATAKASGMPASSTSSTFGRFRGSSATCRRMFIPRPWKGPRSFSPRRPRSCARTNWCGSPTGWPSN